MEVGEEQCLYNTSSHLAEDPHRVGEEEEGALNHSRVCSMDDISSRSRGGGTVRLVRGYLGMYEITG